MTQWAAFVGLTGAVLTAFLVLARLSQQLVEPADGDPAGSDADEDGAVDPTAGPGVPTDAADGRSDRPSGDADGSLDERIPPTDPDGPVTGESAERDGADPRSGDDERAVANGRGRAFDDGRPGVADDRFPDGDVTATPFGLERTSEVRRERIEQPELSPGALLANVALTQGLFGFLLAAGAWYFQVPAAALGLGAGRLGSVPAAVAVGAAFGLALWVGNELASGLADASGVDYDEGLRETLAPDSARGWALLLGVTLPIIAGVEEFIFRAAAIGAPAAGFHTSPWALAVVSSVAFALGHGAQGRIGVLVTGALGFALAAGFVLTESLVVVFVAHYLVNALEFGVHEGLGASDPPFGSLW